MSRNDSLSRTYLQTLKKHTPLPDKELNALVHKAHLGDQEAFNKVVQTNLRFVIRVASTFRNAELSFEERVAEGNLGLMRAIEKFDPSLGYKFTTYAVWWIRQAIQKAIWRNKQPFHRPLNQFEDWDLIRRKTDQLAQKKGLSPTVEEVSNTLDMTPQRFEAALNTQYNATSLDTPTTEDGPTLSERLADNDPTPCEQLETKETAQNIQGALANLPSRDAEIIALTFGFDGEKLSFSKVGKRLGISKERVRQLRNRALANLRSQLQRFESSNEDTHNTITLNVAQKPGMDKVCA